MRTIGILGGMSWESSAQYYAIINRAIRDRLGGITSAKIILHSFDFDEVARLQREGEWHALGQMLGNAASGLEHAGADCVLIATNTMHLVAPEVEAATISHCCILLILWGRPYPKPVMARLACWLRGSLWNSPFTQSVCRSMA